MGNPLADALAEYRDQLTSSTGPVADPARPARRWRWWLILVLTVVMLAAGAWLALRPGTPAAAPAGPATAPSPAAPPPTAATATPTGAAALAVAPAAQWTAWQSALVRTWRPVIAGAGPSDPPAAGFAHTAQGALAAAGTLLPMAYYATPRQQWTLLADTRVTWAPGQREQLAAELAPAWQDPPTTSQLTPLGYRVVSYAPEHARFRMWWQLDVPSATVGALVEVVWQDGDWKLFFDEPAMDLRGITGTDTYLPWGPA